MLATRTSEDCIAPEPGQPLTSPKSVRLGVICDLVEENWPSMDLIGGMLVAHLKSGPPRGIDPVTICPSMARRFTAALGDKYRFAFNADRFLNRFWDYPRFLRSHLAGFDLFHLVDHSYAQLVLELPPGRTVVTCHDTDTFRCLLEPEAKRSAPFSAMVRRTLRGLSMAAVVVCPSVATRDALLSYGLVPEDRLRVVPLGFHPSCCSEPDPRADLEAERLLGAPHATQADLLHVGSTVPRKRLDTLLRIFAEIKRGFPGARLVRVGGPFTPAQELMIDELRLRDSVLVLPSLERPTLAAVYRRAAAVLLPSEREGFGLPVVEAMACGTPVIASDIAALREIGGNCAVYCSPGNVPEWSRAVSELLLERRENPKRWRARCNRSQLQASLFTWARFTSRMVTIYRETLAGLHAIHGEVVR
jgi:glycosyltransferase involved in cell wall biosynthesis